MYNSYPHVRHISMYCNTIAGKEINPWPERNCFCGETSRSKLVQDKMESSFIRAHECPREFSFLLLNIFFGQFT